MKEIKEIHCCLRQTFDAKLPMLYDGLKSLITFAATSQSPRFSDRNCFLELGAWEEI